MCVGFFFVFVFYFFLTVLFCLRVVVERDVVHAEVWLQALEGAV